MPEENENKTSKELIKVVTLGDHPMLPSGVGTQSNYVIQSLLNSGKFQVYSLAGAVKHNSYEPVITNEYQQRWVCQPVDGYGTPDIIRKILVEYKPDIFWIMTDPRYYEWFWDMEAEIRDKVPIVYYHVWDNYPYPNFNKRWYESNDHVATISKVTSDIVQTVCPEVDETYIPHAVAPWVFKPLPEQTLKEAREAIFSGIHEGARSRDVVFYWSNRNARRKMPGSLMKWYAEFLDQDEIDRSRVTLICHTDPNDVHGQPLHYLAEEFGLNSGEFILSTEKLPPEHLAMMYNVASFTLNIADAEGFGLSSLESLSCGTPVINSMTGGLQEQVTDGENWFGIGINPVSKAVIGSQQVPYIYEDRVSGTDVIAALTRAYHMDQSEYKKLSDGALQHVRNNYNFEDFGRKWVDLMTSVHEKNGSYENRKNHKNRWGLIQL